MLDRKSEFKIGLFVILAGALFFWSLFRLDFFKKEAHQNIQIQFNYAEGLESGAAVKLAGVQIGAVDGIQIVKDNQGNTKVQVQALIHGDYDINSNSDFKIRSKGILGTKYIEIIPSSSQQPTNLANDYVYTGTDPIIFDEILVSSQAAAKKLETTADSITSLVSNSEFKEQFKENVTHLKELMVELKVTSQNLNYLLKNLNSGKGLVGKLFTDDTVYNDLKEITSNLKEMTADLKRHPWKLLKKK